MKDVAHQAGVHQTTVSLALRRHPSIPAATRERIERIAAELGYERDPALSALNHYRVSARMTKSVHAIAALLNFEDEAEFNRAPFPHRESVAGASRHAERLGYRLDRFFVGHVKPAAKARQIEKILHARGIQGVIIASFRESMHGFALNWDRFSTVQIESQQLGLPLHTVSSNQLSMTRSCVQRVYERGYRRIGLAVGREEEIYLNHAFTAGYGGEVLLHPELAPLPPLLLPNGSAVPELASLLRTWAQSNSLDCVISNWPEVLDALRHGGWRVPEEIGIACIGVQPDFGPTTGMRQRDDVVGERAIEQLALMMKTFQRGLVAVPNVTLIEGEWMEGAEAPVRTGHSALNRAPNKAAVKGVPR